MPELEMKNLPVDGSCVSRSGDHLALGHGVVDFNRKILEMGIKTVMSIPMVQYDEFSVGSGTGRAWTTIPSKRTRVTGLPDLIRMVSPNALQCRAEFPVADGSEPLDDRPFGRKRKKSSESRNAGTALGLWGGTDPDGVCEFLKKADTVLQ
ncbi:MAG: hypothetical protein MZW92_71975 [Comamonadaceae bacterium]|nr:hypothetical protein [Comamonadaceae bacterium]